MKCLPLLCFALILAPALAPAANAADRLRVGVLPTGPLDLITDVPGVKVGQVTKIEGSPGPLRPGIGPARTGVTVILPNDDVWNKRPSAGFFELNGNGELTGTHWIDEAGFLSSPIALTNTLDVGRVDDGVIGWMLQKYPKIGALDDVPLPVVAECDDQFLNDIRGRHVTAEDTIAALESAHSGAFERGNVGAGTGMVAFRFKGGIGSASRRAGSYTVGVLVNANTGGREDLVIDGVRIGRAIGNDLMPSVPRGTALRPGSRAADGSIIVIVATDAPLEPRQLQALGKRAALGLARTGATSHVSSGDLMLAFSTTRTYPNDDSVKVSLPTLTDDDQLDAIYAATAEATEAAIVDALLSARTMSGAHGATIYALPEARVRKLVGQ
jgi:D-aminopeptidase